MGWDDANFHPILAQSGLATRVEIGVSSYEKLCSLRSEKEFLEEKMTGQYSFNRLVTSKTISALGDWI
jgi:hypothetical protein